MPKIIVTHQGPDLDAVTSVWLLRRFLSHIYGDAHLIFVSAGSTLPAEQAAQLGVPFSDVIHVDTGMGEFDHHQSDRAQQFVCASSLVYDWLTKLQPDKLHNKALRALVEYVTEIDHFRDCYWPEAASLRYEFSLHSLLAGARLHNGDMTDEELTRWAASLLDAAYAKLVTEVQADEIIQKEGQQFSISQGKKGMALATNNGNVEKRSQKLGYELVVRKDEKNGHVRIKATPHSDIDLTPVYERILKEDTIGTWFLHGSKRMLLNGSSKNMTQIPSPLSLVKIVKILQEVL